MRTEFGDIGERWSDDVIVVQVNGVEVFHWLHKWQIAEFLTIGDVEGREDRAVLANERNGFIGDERVIMQI
jgi:hypothetical protein